MTASVKMKSIVRHTWILWSSLSLVLVSQSFAQPQLLGLGSILDETDSVNRFQTAIKGVKETPEIRDLLQKSQIHGLSVFKRISGEILETTQFQHYYKGLQVIGSTAFHHRSQNGVLISDQIKKFDLDTTPGITVEEAVGIAKSATGDRPLRKPPELKILPSSNQNSARLVYWIELAETEFDSARKVFIDAHHGNIIANLPEKIELAPIGIFSAKNRGISITPLADSSGKNLQGCEVVNLMSGELKSVDLSTCKQAGKNQCQVVMDGSPIMIHHRYCAQAPNPLTIPKLRDTTHPQTEMYTQNLLRWPFWLWIQDHQEISLESDATTLRAFENSQKVLNYYLSTHHRNSYDNQGSPIMSVVHAGIGYSNAHWDPIYQRMVYGDGDGKILGDFTRALDVAGHEMTHAITSATAELLPMGEPGALNEAYSDFFGKMIDDDGNWSVGKNLFLKEKEKGIRDLAQPHAIISRMINRPYPDKVSEKVLNEGTCDDANDYCYIHVNSTIPGHAGYLIVQAIGKYRAEKLYYTVLTQALNSNETFKSAANETRKICRSLFDAGTCSKVDQAFVEVGL